MVGEAGEGRQQDQSKSSNSNKISVEGENKNRSVTWDVRRRDYKLNLEIQITNSKELNRLQTRFSLVLSIAAPRLCSTLHELYKEKHERNYLLKVRGISRH